MSEEQDLRLHDGVKAASEAVAEGIDQRAKRLLCLVADAEALGVVTRDLRSKVASQLCGIRALRNTLLGTKEAKAEPAESE